MRQSLRFAVMLAMCSQVAVGYPAFRYSTGVDGERDTLTSGGQFSQWLPPFLWQKWSGRLNMRYMLCLLKRSLHGHALMSAPSGSCSGIKLVVARGSLGGLVEDKQRFMMRDL